MDFYKTTAAFGATACLLMASTAFGAAIRSETFEGSDDVGAWTGGVAQEAGSPAGVAPAGLPISSSAGLKVLSVTGSATNTVGTTSGDTLVDMMVKVSVPDEALTAAEVPADAKFAVAVDTVANETTGQFKYYNGSAWVALSDATYADGAWVRLTMKFYYSKATPACVVALNGNTCGEYNLIASATTLASIEVKGSTALDEVLVTQDTMVAAFSGSDTIGNSIVTKKWLTAFNKTWPETASADLVSQYTLGLDPNGTATTMPLSFEQDADDDKATLSFPGFGAFGGTGTYVLKSSTDKTNWTGNTVVTPSGTGVNTAQISLNSLTPGTAVYYRIEASATAPSNN